MPVSETNKPYLTTEGFYNWQKTMSYDAPVTMVVGARGIGKTFGLRKALWQRYVKTGQAFCEVTRTASELPDVMRGYLDKLQSVFPELFRSFHVRYMKNCVYAAPWDGNEKKLPKTEDYQVVCYGVSLNERGNLKKRTFANVTSVIYDEAIIENRDRWHNYLKDEATALSSVVDTVTRENPNDEDRIRPHVYLLANACDFFNPWFKAFGLTDLPHDGWHWLQGKSVLLHYFKDAEYAEAKQKATVGGLLARISDARYAGISAENLFAEHPDTFVAKKGKSATFSWALVYKSQTFAVWTDWRGDGYFYVQENYPNNARAVYALTAADCTLDWRGIEKASAPVQGLLQAYREGLVMFEDAMLRDSFLDTFASFGLA